MNERERKALTERAQKMSAKYKRMYVNLFYRSKSVGGWLPDYAKYLVEIIESEGQRELF